MSKKKLVLHGIGNFKDFNFYTFDKTKEVHKILFELIEKIFKIRWSLFKTVTDEKGNEKEIPVDISKLCDIHEDLCRTKFFKEKIVDIFYGNKKMFLVIHCPTELRKEFNTKLKESFIIPEVKKKI